MLTRDNEVKVLDFGLASSDTPKARDDARQLHPFPDLTGSTDEPDAAGRDLTRTSSSPAAASGLISREELSRFATSHGSVIGTLACDVNIAYQVCGDGPVDLVFVMGWVSHLEYFWKEPSFARFLRRLASFSRLILFDKRGTGLSDPVTRLPTLELRMDDVRAVLDAVGSTHAVLFGVSEGGPMCSRFAATTVPAIGACTWKKGATSPA
jgi:hypothetical protein